MKLIFTLFAFLALAANQCHKSGGSDAKVLIFSKTKGYRHESIGAGKTAIYGLGKQHGFSVDSTENASLFTAENLKNYRAVIFLNTTMDVLNEAQQAIFEKYIRSGGGYVGVHAAADTEYDWPWYGRLVGAYFNGHPGNPNVREGVVQVKDKNHPATRSLPANWKRNDEWYNYKNIQPDLHVLCNLDETSYEGGTNGPNHPIAWYHDFDGGRAFYTGGGHTDETYAEPLFLEHLWGGIKYAAGLK